MHISSSLSRQEMNVCDVLLLLLIQSANGGTMAHLGGVILFTHQLSGTREKVVSTALALLFSIDS